MAKTYNEKVAEGYNLQNVRFQVNASRLSFECNHRGGWQDAAALLKNNPNYQALFIEATNGRGENIVFGLTTEQMIELRDYIDITLGLLGRRD